MALVAVCKRGSGRLWGNLKDYPATPRLVPRHAPGTWTLRPRAVGAVSGLKAENFPGI